jgi:hypothetical protein
MAVDEQNAALLRSRREGGTAEDDGWLVCMAFHSGRLTSEFLILVSAAAAPLHLVLSWREGVPACISRGVRGRGGMWVLVCHDEPAAARLMRQWWAACSHGVTAAMLMR